MIEMIFIYLIFGLAYSYYDSMNMTENIEKIANDSYVNLFLGILTVTVTWPYQLLKRI